MTEFIQLCNQNPMLIAALLSIVAFPLGLTLTLIVAKRYLLNNIGSGVKSGFETYLKIYREHTATEIKIEERLRELVTQMERMLAQSIDTRQFFDVRIDHVVEKIDDMNNKLDGIVHIIPKRHDDRPQRIP